MMTKMSVDLVQHRIKINFIYLKRIFNYFIYNIYFYVNIYINHGDIKFIVVEYSSPNP